MIPRSRRIPRADFPKHSRPAFSSSYWTAKVSKNSLSYGRCAVVIGAAAVKLAVRRHKLKRFLLDSLYGLQVPGVDIVLIVKKPAGDLTKKQLSAEFDKIKHTLTSYGIS